jgi:ketosteroid isomerase-like protein
MSAKLKDDKSDIRAVLNKINESWLSKKYDEIGKGLTEDVIIAAPGSNVRIKGRDAYIQSYRDYDSVAKTLQFIPEEPQIDIMGDTVAVISPFAVTYQLKGNTYHERGKDILILKRTDSGWLVVWRTMQSEPG